MSLLKSRSGRGWEGLYSGKSRVVGGSTGEFGIVGGIVGDTGRLGGELGVVEGAIRARIGAWGGGTKSGSKSALHSGQLQPLIPNCGSLV